MWLVGTLIVTALGVAVVAIIGWKPRADPSRPVWDIAGLGGTYTGIVGTLAGFTVASAIFIASLDFARAAPAFATEIGMLLAAFLILVFSALTYASTPNLPNSDRVPMQRLSHVLANMTGCLGLSISWLALIPLLEVLDLPTLADVFTWLLLFVTVAAGGWVAMFAYLLTPANVSACAALPIVGFGLAACYRLVGVRAVPQLWPTGDATLKYVFVAFGLVGLLFAIHAGLILAQGSPRGTDRLQLRGHRIALACSEGYILVMGFIWLAVALP